MPRPGQLRLPSRRRTRSSGRTIWNASLPKAEIKRLHTRFDERLEATECRIMAAMAHMESRLIWKMFVAGGLLLGLLLAAMGICTSYITQQL